VNLQKNKIISEFFACDKARFSVPSREQCFGKAWSGLRREWCVPARCQC